MPKDFYNRIFERERQEQEAYALANGYSIADREETTHLVFKTGSPVPMALCASRWDAIKIAYALARVFPIVDAKP